MYSVTRSNALKYCHNVVVIFHCFMVFTVYKEKMFRIDIEDGGEAPKKPSYTKCFRIFSLFHLSQ